MDVLAIGPFLVLKAQQDKKEMASSSAGTARN
jgi:hypothetical protein